jgi:Protein of unknown function (DUF998)
MRLDPVERRKFLRARKIGHYGIVPFHTKQLMNGKGSSQAGEQEKTVMVQIHLQNTAAPQHAPPSVSSLQRWLLMCGPIGSVLFTTTYLVEGVTRPGYNAWQQAISALSLGPGGGVQIVNFIVYGLLICCSAVGWRAALKSGAGAILVPFFEGLTGLGLIVCGIFSQDPAGYPLGTTIPLVTTHGSIHTNVSIIAMISLIVVCFVLAWRFAKEPHWRIWAVYALVSGILTMVFMAAFGASMAHGANGLFVGPAGLFERLAIISHSILTIALVVRLCTGTGRVSSQS